MTPPDSSSSLTSRGHEQRLHAAQRTAACAEPHFAVTKSWRHQVLAAVQHPDERVSP